MNEEIIWNYLIARIQNPYSVSALMGSLYVESKLNPRDLQGSYARKFGMSDDEYTQAVDNGTYDRDKFINDSAGYGLAQWTYWSRKQSLYDYAKAKGQSIGDLSMQLDFLWEEIQTYKTVMKAMASATNIREVSDVIVKRYEKPEHQEEEYLQNRANFAQKYFDKYAGGDIVYTADKVASMLEEWKNSGLSKPDIVINLANACMGWNYIFGDRGEFCTPSHVKNKISSLAKDYPKQSSNLKEKCQITNNKHASSCNGCQFYPGGQTRAFDCRGFTYWCFLNGAGIKIEGAGATSQYDNNNNWSEKGKIANMPRDKVCCVFRYDNNTGKMEHTLIYDGKGNYIHCSTTVKKCTTSQYKATHYAIPKGLYGGDKPVVIIGKAKVIADSGSTVNMRVAPSSNADVIAKVKVGTIVDLFEKGNDWCGIVYGGKNGYMMTKFLQFIDDGQVIPDNMILVSKAELQEVYRIVGDMLKANP